jgi:pimeloyl-ACP methyl ester carboxylesterase
MRVIFSHGHLSSPQSRKIQVLAPVAEALGLETVAIDYTDLRDDPHGRVERLNGIIEAEAEPPILVGSSLGGLVSLVASEANPVAGLFMMAPALYMEDRIPGGVIRERYEPRCSKITVVHGWGDDICPWEGSVRFAGDHQATLHLIAADHRLEDALPRIAAWLEAFLTSKA